MKKSKPKTEPSDTTDLSPPEHAGGVWDDPEFQALDDLTRKLMQVPKKELDEALAKERATKK